MTFFQAYQIVEVSDPDALSLAIAELNNYMHGAVGGSQGAKMQAQGAAQRVLQFEESQLQVTHQNLQGMIRKMSTRPGQRVIV
jgi:hypothetical protein